jgi:phosphatidylglycerophosphate synthase
MHDAATRATGAGTPERRVRLATALAPALAAGALGAMLLGGLPGALYPWKLAVLLAAVALAGAWWRRRAPGVRHALLAAPANRVTLARVALVLTVLAAAGEAASPALAAAITAIAATAAALDGLDGWVARRSATESALGARLDMETDAALVLALALLAWSWDKAGAWVLLAGLARYAFAAAACVAPWMRRPLPPSLRRKTVCVVQVLALIACVSPWVPHPASAWIAAGGLAALLYSFAIDWLWLGRRAREPAAQEEATP